LRRDGFITHVGFPKIPLLRVRNLRVPEGAKINSYCLTLKAGRAYVSAQYSVEVEVVSATGPIIGLDVGLTSLVAVSSGEKIAPPKHGRNLEIFVARTNRSLARKRKNSVNWRRSKRRLQRLHKKASDRRDNHQHQVTRKLVNAASMIAIEKLSLNGLKRTRLAKSFNDAALGNLLNKIRYKSLWAGVAVYEHPRHQRSTGCCPLCGTIGPRLPLGVEIWTCICGAIHDRDVAAAQWLVRCANTVGAANPEPAGEALPPRRKRGFAGMRSKVARPPENHAGPPANVLVDAQQRALT
jgi:putative transposase